MASNNPERPGKQRRQPVNGLKRDQALFGSRRGGRPLQQPPDFLTDSLNTSYIPSPSPPKSLTRQEVRAKPRQALNNGRSVAGSLKATPRINDENKGPSSNSSSGRRHSEQSLKPRPAQTDSRKKTPSPNKPQSPTRARTPSPPRGRQNLITSPVASESSPGRGYAEAYQRIVEEENLAQEDSIEDMEDIDGYEFNEQDRSQDVDRMRLQRIQHSASPIPLKASRRASPPGAVSDSPSAHDGANDEENIAHESDSESGVDYTENITDTSVDSGSSQYAKDLQRLSALKEGAKVFSKARVGEKVGLTVENLQRRNGSNESLGSAFSAGSLSHRGSDPSVNIPKAWGRKAKPGKDWLNRINSKSGRFTGDVPKRHSSGDPMIPENQEREWAEPIDDWIAAAAQVPLPSVEEGSSQTALSSRGSTPTTALQRSSSLDQRRQWEVNDDEFTGRSLQVSDSPPIRIRNGTLDRFRDREIENLEKRAVTTNRLGELREKGSDELLRRRPPSRSAEEPGSKEGNDPQDALQRRRPSGRSSLKSELRDSDQDNTPEATVEDTGEPIPDTPVVIYRSKSNDRSAADDKVGVKSEETMWTSVRPSHERKDSHDLLKRLAKATSESPSPTNDQEKEEPLPVKKEEQVKQTPQTSKPSSNLKTPVVTGAWVDQTMDNTPQPSKSNTNVKTPKITGAWVDTPLPTGGRGPPMPTPEDVDYERELSTAKLGATELIRRLSPNTITERPKLQNQIPLKYSGPPLPKSALEEIINNAKSVNPNKPNISSNSDSEEDPTLHLGDSTIQSLEELIANDTDFSTLLAPAPPSPEEETSQPSSDPSPASQALTTTSTTSTSAKSSRPADLQSYTHLLSRLTNLAPSIRASKKQLASLERAVSSPAPNRNQSITQRGGDDTCNEAGEFHDFIWPCARCGCPGRPTDPDLASLSTLRENLTSITLPIPRLWTWRKDDWRPRLTWLGVLTFLSWALVWLEFWARANYCHPLYARSMVGYGVDINAPRPPFVLAKVIYRRTAIGTLLAPLYHISRIFLRVLGSFVGYIVGFMFGDESGGAGTGKVFEKQPVSRDARIPKPAWGPDLSLMDDEFL
ncbi:hypothetical protein OEA41_010601 [Lepraria neglecta]|uniref:Uncharacterized protein n=1 Tax=Lepraria neglecta TaxID=209136 RepID=A0AAD9YWP8_9LECA|nr:hypothetical protein OEA41_010601 [Lepraria neglecta]